MDNRFNTDLKDKISSLDDVKPPQSTWKQSNSWRRIYRRRLTAVIWIWHAAAAALIIILFLLKISYQSSYEKSKQLAVLKTNVQKLQENNCRLEEQLLEKETALNILASNEEIHKVAVDAQPAPRIVYRTKIDTVIIVDTLVKTEYIDRIVEVAIKTETEKSERDLATVDWRVDEEYYTNTSQGETVYTIDEPERKLTFSLFKKKNRAALVNNDDKLLCLKLTKNK